MDAYILVLLIFDVMGGIWLWEREQDRKDERRRCPVCNRNQKNGSYKYWCSKHRDEEWSKFISRKI